MRASDTRALAPGDLIEYGSEPSFRLLLVDRSDAVPYRDMVDWHVQFVGTDGQLAHAEELMEAPLGSVVDVRLDPCEIVLVSRCAGSVQKRRRPW